MVSRAKELCVLSPWEIDDSRWHYAQVGMASFSHVQILSKWMVIQRDATRFHVFYDDQYRVWTEAEVDCLGTPRCAKVNCIVLLLHHQ